MAAVKPQLRGLGATVIKRNIVISVVASVITGAAWYYGVALPKKQKYAEFYKNYDADASFERQRKGGYFQAAPLEE